MDNPLYPTPSAGSMIVMLISMAFWLLFLGGAGYLVVKFLRANGSVRRMQQTLDGHAARTGYNHGLKDGEQRAHQHLQMSAAQQQLDQLAETVRHVGHRVDDLMRTVTRPPENTGSNRADAQQPMAADNRRAPTDPATPTHASEPGAVAEAAPGQSGHRLGLRKPNPKARTQPPNPAPASRPIPPVPVAAAADATSPESTPAAVSHS